MGIKKRAIVPLTMASILAASAGLASFVWADSSEGLVDETLSNMPIQTTCAGLQDAINNAPVNYYDNFSYISLTESCSANLVIPSGKRVRLELWPDHNLTNNGEDTVTVEEGAVFYYDGMGSSSVISNTTSGKAVINNHGLVRIFDANLQAENEAYTTINSGELNILIGGNYSGTKINNTGAIRITDGTFDNLDEIKPYLVGGGKIDENTGRVYTLSDGERLYAGIPDETFLPVGYTFTVKMTYPDYADAFNFRYEPSGAIKVTGSNQEGWTFTVTDAGMFSYGTRVEFWGVGEFAHFGYKVTLDTSDEVKDLITELVGKLSSTISEIRQAIESGKTISLSLNIDNQATIEDAKKEQIAEVAGEDQILGYYDISLALKGDDEKLADITDLEEDDIEVRLPADFLNDLEAVKDGYKRDYYVIRYHEGAAEKIDAKLEGEELVFSSSKFSTYAVAYTDTQTSGNSSDDNSGDNNTNNAGSNSNVNNGSNDNQNSNSGSNTNTDNNSAKAPNTGLLAYFSNGEASIALVGVLALATVSGLFTFKAISKKQRK